MTLPTDWTERESRSVQKLDPIAVAVSTMVR